MHCCLKMCMSPVSLMPSAPCLSNEILNYIDIYEVSLECTLILKFHSDMFR